MIIKSKANAIQAGPPSDVIIIIIIIIPTSLNPPTPFFKQIEHCMKTKKRKEWIPITHLTVSVAIIKII